MKKDLTPRVIALASLKGGSSKTTLSAALAAKLVASGATVALVDTDPDASLEKWHELRKSPKNPYVIDMDGSSEALGLLRSHRWDYLIIDTPPSHLDRVEAVVFVADFVIIPVKTSIMDLESVSDVVDKCKEYGKPYAAVLTQVPEKGFVRLAKGARGYLAKMGCPVFETQMEFRKEYISSMTFGKSAVETDARARAEIDKLWDELQALARAYHE